MIDNEQIHFKCQLLVGCLFDPMGSTGTKESPKRPSLFTVESNRNMLHMDFKPITSCTTMP